MYTSIQEDIVREAEEKVARTKYEYEKAVIDLHMAELRLQGIRAGYVH